LREVGSDEGEDVEWGVVEGRVEGREEEEGGGRRTESVRTTNDSVGPR